MNKKTHPATTIHSDRLKRLLKKEPATNSDIDLRLHRAISWLKAAEQNQDDLRFISLWIAFNACYAGEDVHELTDRKTGEKSNIRDFFFKLESIDIEHSIAKLFWNHSNEINQLLSNQFLFPPFWNFIRDHETDFKKSLENSLNRSRVHLMEGRVTDLLVEILGRLYLLRNQLIHGSATYKGEKNRKSLKQATIMLELLIPLLIEIMICNKNESWGRANFPPVE